MRPGRAAGGQGGPGGVCCDGSLVRLWPCLRQPARPPCSVPAPCALALLTPELPPLPAHPPSLPAARCCAALPPTCRGWMPSRSWASTSTPSCRQATGAWAGQREGGCRKGLEWHFCSGARVRRRGCSGPLCASSCRQSRLASPSFHRGPLLESCLLPSAPMPVDLPWCRTPPIPLCYSFHRRRMLTKASSHRPVPLPPFPRLLQRDYLVLTQRAADLLTERMRQPIKPCSPTP